MDFDLVAVAVGAISRARTLSVKVYIPAKINLWLEVLAKRSDGYHELSSLMLPIGLYDVVELTEESRHISVTCSHPDVPQNSENLAWRAAEKYLAIGNLKAGVQIRLTKNIPVGAGLGGGSADAAAVLLAMNRLFQHTLTMEQLHHLAKGLGADVPFFLYQEPMLATGIGEKLEKVQGLPNYPLVLIKPPLSVSTRWVYQRLKLTRGQSRIKIATFLAHPWRLQDVMENDLETVTLAEYPLLAKIKQWLLEQGAAGALMSGSGPTVFGIFSDGDAVQKVAQQAKQTWERCRVVATHAQSEVSACQFGQ